MLTLPLSRTRRAGPSLHPGLLRGFLPDRRSRSCPGPFLRPFLGSLLRPVLGLLLLAAAAPVQAQEAGEGRPRADPFARSAPPATPPTALVGAYERHEFNAYDGSLTFQTGPGGTGYQVLVQPWAAGVVKVEVLPPPSRRPAAPDSSFSVVQPAATNLAQESYSTPQTIELLLRDGMRVSVQKQPLRLTFIGATGDTLLRDTPTGPTSRAARPLPELGLNFRLSPTESLYGTGSRALATNRRGQHLPLYNAAHYSYQNGDPQLNTTLPVVLSSRGYGLFIDNHTAGYFDLGAAAPNELRYAGEELAGLRYFVIAGPGYARILERYTALTGRQPLPPRWAMGLIQSRFGYKSEREMYRVAKKMRGAGFPLDALVLDLYWFGTTKDQGNLAWQRDSFPDPPRMMRRLDSMGVKTVLISEPYVMRASTNDGYVRQNGLVGTDSAGRPYTVASFWAGPASLLDMFKPATDAWLWASYKKRLEEGAGGFWSDLGEPENHPVGIRHRLGYTRRVHNAYGMAWAQIYAKHFAREYPDRRLFNLARSGWAGMQRLSVFPWSGDIHRSWSGFQAQVPIMLGMALSGVGYMHSDAGGFCVGPYDGELYTRWLQHAALSPIFRPHGEGVPPEPYWYPEPYQSAVRAAAQERSRLLPYLYSLAWRNTTTGEPLARPLFWDERGTLAAHLLTAQDDAYLLGPNLLVAPVLNPGQRQRNVPLPGTGRWFDFRTGRALGQGGQTITVAAPLAHTPLLARANAVVPVLARARPSTAGYSPADTLTLRVFADPTGAGQAFTFYDDDGRSARALENGQYQTLTCTTRPLDGTRVALTLLPGMQGLPTGARRWLLLEVPTGAGWQVAGGRGVQPQGGSRPIALPWPMQATTLILNCLAPHLFATNVPSAGPPTVLPAWLGAPNDYGRFYPDHATFDLPVVRAEAGESVVTLRDARHRVVRTFRAVQPAGTHRFSWDGRTAAGQPVAQGIYSAELNGQVVRIVKL